MLVNVISAKYVDNFIIKLNLKTQDDTTTTIIHKEVDLYEYLQNKKDSGLFAPLKNIEYFKNFKLNANTIEWENGVDIAPERFLEL
jgi:hypothetical protein